MCLQLGWEGKGVEEVGRVVAAEDAEGPQPGNVIVRIDQCYFRAMEVETQLGNPGKAKRRLGWEPTTSFYDLVREMITVDLEIARRDAIMAREGFQVMNHRE